MKKYTADEIKNIILNGTAREQNCVFTELYPVIIKMIKNNYRCEEPEAYLSNVYMAICNHIDKLDLERYDLKAWMALTIHSAVYKQNMEYVVLSMSRGVKELAMKVSKAKAKLAAKNENEPTLSEIADYLGVETVDVADAIAANDVDSLDRTIGDEEDGWCLGDTIENTDDVAIDNGELKTDIRRCIKHAISKGIVTENQAEAFLKVFSPEDPRLPAADPEDIAELYGYNSAAALNYHIEKIKDYLAQNKATRALLMGYLDQAA